MEYGKRFLALGLTALTLFSCMAAGVLQVHAIQEEIPIVIEEDIPVPAETVFTPQDTAAQQDKIHMPPIVIGASDPVNNDTLYTHYLYSLFYGSNEAAPIGELARNQLNIQGQHLYDYLKSRILLVASGSLSSTTFSITHDQITSWNSTGIYNTTDSSAALSLFMEEFQVMQVIDALLNDCPYELYWYDKVTGLGISYSGYYCAEGILITDVPFCFQVVADHRTASYNANAPTMNTAKAGAAVSAAANAKQIVAKNAEKTDYQKLLAYKNEICSLVTYNTSVSAGGFSTDADPWQLIYVFDGKPTTSVVCEGYSKAFQYLCDLSSFTGTVFCSSVIGIMEDAGAHMWNIVTINGKNYLADITNSDGGTVGSDGRLFLAGGRGSITGGYTAGGERYTYHSDMLTLWGSGSSSILKLSQTGYSAGSDPCSGGHTWKDATCMAPKYCSVCGTTEGSIADHTKVTDAAKEATCGTSGLTEGSHCSVCGKILVAQKEIPATGNHSYTDGICNICGASQTQAAPVLSGSNNSLSGKPTLRWNAVNSAVKYQIYRSKTGVPGSFGLINTVKALSATNNNAVAGSRYSYKVRAVFSDGAKSDYSNVVTLTCDLPRPTGIKVTSNPATGKNVISWDPVAGASKYQVWYSTTGKTGSFKVLMTTQNQTHTHAKALAGTKYYYKVKALHSNTEADSSLTGWFSRVCDLAAPTGVMVTGASSGKNQISWNPVPGASKYQVWYSKTGASGSFSCLMTTQNLAHTHKGGASGTGYYYKVKAVHSNTAANSAYSTIVFRISY